MRNRNASLLAVLLLAGCGGGDGEGGGTPSPSVATLPGGSASAGAQLALRSGCLACHRLGGEGHDGPGRDLTRIGAERSRAQIARALVDPPPPMPSYAELPRKDLALLSDYLAALR